MGGWNDVVGRKEVGKWTKRDGRIQCCVNRQSERNEFRLFSGMSWCLSLLPFLLFLRGVILWRRALEWAAKLSVEWHALRMLNICRVLLFSTKTYLPKSKIQLQPSPNEPPTPFMQLPSPIQQTPSPQNPESTYTIHDIQNPSYLLSTPSLLAL